MFRQDEVLYVHGNITEKSYYSDRFNEGSKKGVYLAFAPCFPPSPSTVAM